MPSQLAQALDRVVARLAAAGIAATTEPRDLTLPGAWVTVHDITGANLCGELVVRADVCLIAGDFGAPLGIEETGELLDKALTVIDIDEPARPANVTPPGLKPMPALVVTTTTD